ncbi:GGDEF domain-containing protein [Anaerophilus nitritogenes]|uniref:GGDEF domain-containing protein n=1 Tax=Anaerophilus nitritogenes TaxID=2498136 RepID=UPI0013EA267B|nr:GGDEF domain-containing protein [Anaerophilus nitritogenes]
MKRNLWTEKDKACKKYIWMGVIYLLNVGLFIWSIKNYCSWESCFLYLLGISVGFSFFHNMTDVNFYTGITFIINIAGILMVPYIKIGKDIYFIYTLCILIIFYMITRRRIKTECNMIERKLFDKTRFDHIKDGILVFRYEDLTVIEYNDTINSFLQEKELIGKCIDEIFQESIAMTMHQTQLKNYFKNGNEKVILQNKKLGSKWVDLNLKIFYVFDKKYLLLCISDVSAHKEDKENIEYLAYHDCLTNLPNRRYGNEKLKCILEKARDEKTMVGVMFIDLDKFKFANDLLGHAAGDELLKKVAKRIQQSIRKNDLVVRIGGDEFMILMDGFCFEDEVIQIADRILNVFSKPFFIKKREIYVTCSIGISIFPHHGATMENLLEQADIAMYEAKNNGRNNYKIYNKKMEQNILIQKTVHF